MSNYESINPARCSDPECCGPNDYYTGSDRDNDAAVALLRERLMGDPSGMRVVVTLTSGQTRTLYNVRPDTFVFQSIKGAAMSDTPDVLVLSMEHEDDSISYIPGVSYWTSHAE
jgi:hypothetical protein